MKHLLATSIIACLLPLGSALAADAEPPAHYQEAAGKR